MSNESSTSSLKIDQPTRVLADWLATCRSAIAIEEVSKPAKRAILDHVGVAIAASRLPTYRTLLSEMRRTGGSGSCVVIGEEHGASPLVAAFLNATAAHFLDFDDVNRRMHGHPTAPILPAILAATGVEKCSGLDLIVALTAGTEAECFVSQSLGTDHFSVGWHPTATVGVVGAAAAASVLQGLGAMQISHALGFAVAQSAGLRSMFGSFAKPFQVGKAAMNGLLAANLAACGMTARLDSLECEHGLFCTYGRRIPVLPSKIGTRPLGIEENIFKAYCSCFYTHSAIAIAEGIARDQALVPEEIVSVQVSGFVESLKACSISNPSSVLELKFSIASLVAMALCGMDLASPASLEFGLLRDDVRNLATKIRLEPVWDMDRMAARIKIVGRDGLVFERAHNVSELASGSEYDKVRLKFLSLVSPALGECVASELSDMILNIEKLGSASDLLRMLGRPRAG